MSPDGNKSPGNREYLVGVYYFSGWWPESPNKYFAPENDWLIRFPERRPLLGLYNDQETMDREIKAAASHSVDFFQILWYRQTPDSDTAHNAHLNDGLRCFMNSPNNGLMRFTLEAVNHPGFLLDDETVWQESCKEWIEVMKHPRYLRVDGRPVIKIHGLDFFAQQSGGVEGVAKRVQQLREMAMNAGLPNPLVSAGVMPGGVSSADSMKAYDFVTTYMDMPGVPKDIIHPYSCLLDWAEQGWNRYAQNSSKPYVPYVPSGWDPRPWGDPRPSFALPNRQEWTDALLRVKNALDRSANLGVPTSGKRQKMILIYAWNEFGEGGIVAPTQGDEEMKLEAIEQVFGK